MKKLILSVLFTLLLVNQAMAEIVSAGMVPPVTLPNGRSGSTSIAVYQTLHRLDFSLTTAKSVLMFTTADLYMTSCSSTGDTRCPYGELVTGNQRLVVVDQATNREVYNEIYKFALTAGSLYAPGVRPEDKPSIRPAVTQTSTIHAVTNLLPAGRYQLQLQVRNDFNPMSVHVKRLTVMH